MEALETQAADAGLALTTGPPDHLQISLSGDWLLGKRLPAIGDALAKLDKAELRRLSFDSSRLGDWDTGLVTFLAAIKQSADQHDVEIDDAGLPVGAKKLVRLAFAVGERKGARREQKQEGFFSSLGKKSLGVITAARDLAAFIGSATLSFGRLLRGKAQYQRSDFWVTVQEAGAEALLIVGVISFLVGVILAFVGVIQLEKFAAGIFVADLVAIGMVREMGAMMTGIVMAGRTGAAFAARLGTMKVNEEIDALTTLGLDPIDFLVLPRMLALIIMMPLLAMYANLLGILGGAAVGLTMLDVSPMQYWVQTKGAINLVAVFGGLFKAAVYGVLIAVAGCQRGLETGGSASAVGVSTTSAVVTGIVMIIVSCAILTVVYITLGI